MGDLDFEELDRAINDLSAELDRQVEPEPTPAPKPKTKKVAPKADVVVVKKKPVAAKAIKGHSSGHFMDMVHPSSDAQVQHKHNFADERQAKIDAARKLAEEEASSDGEVEVSKPKKSNKIAIQTGDEAASEPTKKSEKVEKSAPEAVKPISRRRATKVSNDNQRTRHDLAQPLPTSEKSVSATEEIMAASYETPFLPDVKVDKKPLGGVRPTGANRKSNEATSANATAKSELDAEADKYKDEIDSLVAELHDNLAKPTLAPRHQKRMNENDKKSKAAKPSKNEARKWLRVIGYAIAVIGIVAAGILLGLFFYYYGF